MDINPTGRFSDRVENYMKYRPTYPDAVLEILRQQTGLSTHSIIADIGAGTGISTRLFLNNGNPVLAVEPNDEMRQAAECVSVGVENFQSVSGTAEQTTLGRQSVDYVIAAQSFHWFDRLQVKREFRRILRPGGWVCLLWNTRRIDATPFLKAYEALLQTYGTDYQVIRHRNISYQMLQEFLGSSMQRFQMPNSQRFDYDSLKGRLLSSSYTPNENHPSFWPMLHRLEHLFETYAVCGQVSFEYETELYFARWK